MKTTLSPEALAALIARLTDHVVAECSAVDTEARFDAMFDETHEVPDWLPGNSAARLLRECCPTDYRCGVADMTGTDDTLREIRGEYYDEKGVEAARESFVDELREELAKAEKELAAEEADDDPRGVFALRATVARLEAEIDAAENHAL